MTVRSIRKKDAEGLSKLLSSISKEASFIYTEGRLLSGEMEKLFLHPGKQIYVLENDGILVGYCIVALGMFPENSHTAKIQSMGIMPDQQNRGRGKILLSAVIERLKQEDKKVITLEVVDKNTPAVKLYKSLGFIEIGRIKGAFIKMGNKSDILIMSLYV